MKGKLVNVFLLLSALGVSCYISAEKLFVASGIMPQRLDPGWELFWRPGVFLFSIIYIQWLFEWACNPLREFNDVTIQLIKRKVSKVSLWIFWVVRIWGYKSLYFYTSIYFGYYINGKNLSIQSLKYIDEGIFCLGLAIAIKIWAQMNAIKLLYQEKLSEADTKNS